MILIGKLDRISKLQVGKGPVAVNKYRHCRNSYLFTIEGYDRDHIWVYSKVLHKMQDKVRWYRGKSYCTDINIGQKYLLIGYKENYTDGKGEHKRGIRPIRVFNYSKILKTVNRLKDKFNKTIYQFIKPLLQYIKPAPIFGNGYPSNY